MIVENLQKHMIYFSKGTDKVHEIHCLKKQQYTVCVTFMGSRHILREDNSKSGSFSLVGKVAVGWNFSIVEKQMKTGCKRWVWDALKSSAIGLAEGDISFLTLRYNNDPCSSHVLWHEGRSGLHFVK